MQLIVNTFGAFVDKSGDREQAVSAHKVASLLIATGATLSTDAIQLAAAHAIDIVCLDTYGDPYGRVWQPRLGGTTAIRRRQLEAAAGPHGALC